MCVVFHGTSRDARVEKALLLLQDKLRVNKGAGGCSKSEKMSWNKVFMMFAVPVKHFHFSATLSTTYSRADSKTRG